VWKCGKPLNPVVQRFSAASGAAGKNPLLAFRTDSQPRPNPLYRLGPRSTCGQSSGIRLSGSTAPPPPHRSPLRNAASPQVTFMKLDGKSPSEISTPVAGQLRWVDRLSGAVGRPWRPSRRCCSRVRNPETIETRRPPILTSNSLADDQTRCIVSIVTPQRSARSQTVASVTNSRSGTRYQLGMGRPYELSPLTSLNPMCRSSTAWTVPAPNPVDTPRKARLGVVWG